MLSCLHSTFHLIPHISRLEAAERERRLKEMLDAKLKRKLQLTNLRARAGSRATGETRRRVQRDRQDEERRRREGEELIRMRSEEAKQLAGGDRLDNFVCQYSRKKLLFCTNIPILVG